MKTILLIEDDEKLQHAYSLMLRKKGYHVLNASDGQEGLKLALSEHIDLVISDIYMPKKNGLIVIKQIRRILKYKSMPIIVLSAGGTKQNVYRGIELGVDAFLTKPCRFEDLNFTVKRLLASKSGLKTRNKGKMPFENSLFWDAYDKSILLVYNNPSVTDNLYEYLTEHFYKVDIDDDLSRAEDIMRSKKTDLLIIEVNNPYEPNFKFLFNLFSQEKYVDIPVIIISEMKNELKEVFDSLHFQVDKFLMKPFAYKNLYKAIAHTTDQDYLKRRYKQTLKRLREKINENKCKENAVVNNFRREITSLENENKITINNHSISKQTKYDAVNANIKHIKTITQKISNANQLFLKRRQYLVESRRRIEDKIKSFEKKEVSSEIKI